MHEGEQQLGRLNGSVAFRHRFSNNNISNTDTAGTTTTTVSTANATPVAFMKSSPNQTSRLTSDSRVLHLSTILLLWCVCVLSL